MIESVYNELLLKHYQYRNEVETISKDAFMLLYNMAYPEAKDVNPMSDSIAWKGFSENSIIGKIEFVIENFGKLFEAYCIGFYSGSQEKKDNEI